MQKTESFEGQNIIYGKALTAWVYSIMLEMTKEGIEITNKAIKIAVLQKHVKTDLLPHDDRNLLERITKTTASIERSGLCKSKEIQTKNKTRKKIFYL